MTQQSMAHNGKTKDTGCRRNDPLTGLPATDEFLRRSNAFVAAHSDGPWCIIKLDVGHMTIFNEWYGKARGDELLAAVGAALDALGDADWGVAGYWGQDDFLLLMAYDPVAIEQVYDDMRHVVASFDDSIGFLPAMGVYPLATPAHVSIDECSKAVYAARLAKRSYKDRVGYFKPAEYARHQREHTLLSRFQRALTEDRIEFYLQPQVNIDTGQIVGAEALARWRAQDGTYVSPGEFIPVLEHSGFVASLDQYLWRRVITWLARRVAAGERVVPVSLNVSRVDIDSFDVAQCVEQLLEQVSVPAHLVKFEITESALAQDRETVGALIARLKALGCSVHMDDFGCGQSSLAMLRDVAVDAIKLDRSFLPTGGYRDDRAVDIMQSVAALSRSLGVPVVVEGVETADQLALVRTLGLSYVQGYYYHRPMDPGAFEQLLAL